jgi:hypothetical protein
MFGFKELPPGIQKGKAFLHQKFLNDPLDPICRTISVIGRMRSRALHTLRWAGTGCFAMSRLTTVVTD